MAVFQPPPTWAEPVIVDRETGKSKFNPVWLKWFLDIVGVLDSSGGGGGTIQHNATGGLQGGTANQFYHLSAAENSYLSALVTGPVLEKQGAAVAAGNNLDLGSDGNYFQITGATQINLLSSTSWTGGSKVTLKFNSNPVVKNNQAVSGAFKPILLAGGADFSATANDTLTLRYDSTDSVWYEQSRAVI